MNYNHLLLVHMHCFTLHTIQDLSHYVKIVAFGHTTLAIKSLSQIQPYKSSIMNVLEMYICNT